MLPTMIRYIVYIALSWVVLSWLPYTTSFEQVAVRVDAPCVDNVKGTLSLGSECIYANASTVGRLWTFNYETTLANGHTIVSSKALVTSPSTQSGFTRYSYLLIGIVVLLWLIQAYRSLHSIARIGAGDRPAGV